MLSTNDVLKILNAKEKKYTIEQANNIKVLLYQLGDIAYAQYKNSKKDENEKGIVIYPGIYRRAS